MRCVSASHAPVWGFGDRRPPLQPRFSLVPDWGRPLCSRASRSTQCRARTLHKPRAHQLGPSNPGIKNMYENISPVVGNRNLSWKLQQRYGHNSRVANIVNLNQRAREHTPQSNRTDGLSNTHRMRETKQRAVTIHRVHICTVQLCNDDRLRQERLVKLAPGLDKPHGWTLLVQRIPSLQSLS